MTPSDLRMARATLGLMWGRGRPLYMSELGRALGLQGRDQGLTVARWEAGRHAVPGPARVAINAMLGGYRPLTILIKP